MIGQMILQYTHKMHQLINIHRYWQSNEYKVNIKDKIHKKYKYNVS